MSLQTKNCCRTCIQLQLGLALSALILYLIYRPVRPRYFVTAFSVSSPSPIATAANLTAAFNIQIENKNRQIALLHDAISVSVSLPTSNLSSSPDPIPSFHQGHQKTAEFPLTAHAANGSAWAAAIANGSAVFRVSVASAFRYKAFSWKSRHHAAIASGNVAVDNQGQKKTDKGIRLSAATPAANAACLLVILPLLCVVVWV